MQAVESPASPNETVKGIIRTTVWKILPETDVLVHLGEALRDERGQARKRHRQQRKERRRERRRLRRAARAAESAFVGNSTAAVEINHTGNTWDAGAMGALKSLYYVPAATTATITAGSQYRPVTSMPCRGRDDDTLSSTSTSSSDGESLPLTPPPKKSKTTGTRRVKKGPPDAAAVLTTTGTIAHVQKKEPKVNFHYKAKPSRSSKAVMEQEGETELPKGVTVRPSGKWVGWVGLSSCLLAFFSFSLTVFGRFSKPKLTLQDNHVTWVCTIPVAWRPAPMWSFKTICACIAETDLSLKTRPRKNWHASLQRPARPPTRLWRNSGRVRRRLVTKRRRKLT